MTSSYHDLATPPRAKEAESEAEKKRPIQSVLDEESCLPELVFCPTERATRTEAERFGFGLIDDCFFLSHSKPEIEEFSAYDVCLPSRWEIYEADE